MNTTTTGRSFTVRAATAGLALSLFGLITAIPAQAHDSLVSTSPAEGETITTDPGEVSLTLTGVPQSSDALQTTIIEVTAEDGHPASSGEVTVNGPVISTGVELEHADSYTVDWRTVSADGHPIEGSYVFTYAPDGEAVTPATTGPTTATDPSASSTGEASSTGTNNEVTAPTGTESSAAADDAGQVDAAPASQNTDNSTGTIIGIAVAAVIAAAAIAFFLGRRARGGSQS
ncbi:copper resistance CopC family protein [Arthrobacter cheniae]|nr:copper resistance CopC family protein [Arthrobacter cheniae]